jgi:WD40 repeat protein/serine/threonine protein kinase
MEQHRSELPQQPSVRGHTGALCDRFEAAWRAGGCPRIEEWFAPDKSGRDEPWSSEVLMGLIYLDLEHRWHQANDETVNSRAPTENTHAGGGLLPPRPRLEDYLHLYPVLGPADRLPDALIVHEYRVRHRFGDRPSAEQYLQRFPAQAARLERAFAEQDLLLSQAMGQVAPSRGAKGVRSIAELSRVQLIERLVESGLMSADQVATFETTVADGGSGDDGRTLLAHLVDAGRLTPFQAQAIGQGQTKGMVLGEYVLLDKLGEGGMGEVYKARHRTMERVVALKVLSHRLVDSPEAIRRFRQEVKAAARLMHPNIVVAHDAGEYQGTHYLVTEYVDGQDLGKLLRQRGQLPIAEAVGYVVQAAHGLHYAHQHGVVHRDIKPSNLLVDREGLVKVLDMGLARLEEPQQTDDGAGPQPLTGSSQVMGTWEYIAPEQAMAACKADHRSDIYSLGCTLYRLLTGQTLYRGSSMLGLFLAHREAPIPRLREVRPETPNRLDAIYQKMVAKRPEDRQQSMAEVIAELQDCLAHAPKPSWNVRRRWAAGIGALGLAAILGVLAATASRPPADISSNPAANAGRDGGSPRRSPVSDRSGYAALELLSPHHYLGKQVYSVAFSPDSRALALGGDRPVIELWDIDSGAMRWIEGHVTSAGRAVFSPDGKILAAGSLDGTIKLWDLPKGELRATLTGHTSVVHTLAFSPDGSLLVSGGGGHQGNVDSSIRIWNVGDGTPRHTIPGIKDRMVREISFSPDGNTLACASAQMLQLWDVNRWEMTQTFRISSASEALSCSFSPDGHNVVGGDGEGAIVVCNCRTGKTEDRLCGHTKRVWTLAFSPDGRLLASGSGDGTVRLWDWQTRKEIAALTDYADEPRSLKFSPDGRFFACGCLDGTVQLWRLRDLPPQPTKAGGGRSGEPVMLKIVR